MTRKKKDHDFAVNAFRVVQEAIDPKPLDPEPELIDGKNPYAVILVIRSIAGIYSDEFRQYALVCIEVAMASKRGNNQGANLSRNSYRSLLFCDNCARILYVD